MLRVCVDVNGRPISQIAIVNMTQTQSGVNQYEVYECSGVSSGESVIEVGEYLCEVDHLYEDGAAKLIELVMAELESLPE